jgi:hypothetical protein
VLDGDQGLVEGGWNFSSPICDDGEGGELQQSRGVVDGVRCLRVWSFSCK